MFVNNELFFHVVFSSVLAVFSVGFSAAVLSVSLDAAVGVVAVVVAGVSEDKDIKD